jgi:acetylornithine deacetylase/succinyl-diaminopimelate desuccinylase-like protein
MTAAARAYAREHHDTHRAQLRDLIRIPSVSTDAHRRADMQRAADFVADDLRANGAANVQILLPPNNGHPAVYGEWLGAGDAPTVLVYGHYDVQPAHNPDGTPNEGWLTDPFDPVERDGFIYARGASDDKGQMFIHLKAFEAYMKTAGRMPVNLKFLIEGEEEIGSKNLTALIEAHRTLLAADVCVISDTGMNSADQPAITYSTRGLTYMEIHTWGPAKDMHSGLVGGVVHNPALALVQILAQMHNPDGSVAVPGFYNSVRPLDAAEREAMRATDLSEAEVIAMTRTAEKPGIPAVWGEAAYTLRERVGARPTFEINGLFSGFTGEGTKTVLPARAFAKVSCRLVAEQQPRRIFELVRDYVARITPPTVYSEVRLLDVMEPGFVDYTMPMMNAAVAAYREGWNAAPVFVREGGSLGVIADMKRLLGIPTILMGFGLNDDGAHGPNEHFSISMFERGIDTAILFLSEAAHVR